MSADEHLAELRRHVAGLLAQIDTAEMPAPDKVHKGAAHDGADSPPGAEWLPIPKWRIFTIDSPDGADAVFVDHDDYGFPGDWEALRIDWARRVGMALLAAADWAEERRGPVRRLDNARLRQAASG